MLTGINSQEAGSERGRGRGGDARGVNLTPEPSIEGGKPIP